MLPLNITLLQGLRWFCEFRGGDNVCQESKKVDDSTSRQARRAKVKSKNGEIPTPQVMNDKMKGNLLVPLRDKTWKIMRLFSLKERIINKVEYLGREISDDPLRGFTFKNNCG